MSFTERAIGLAITGRITHDEAALVADIDARVCRTILCPITGRILDTRTAQLVEILPPGPLSHAGARADEDWYPGGIVAAGGEVAAEAAARIAEGLPNVAIRTRSIPAHVRKVLR